MANGDEIKRAETVLRIAQLKFKQMLKKEETVQSTILSPIALESSAQFCSDLDAVFQQNTSGNVETCKKWIVKHIVPSKARIAVLGEYLVAVSRSFVVDQASKSAKAARNRLDILLVVSDVLHTDKFHRQEGVAQGVVASALNPYIEELVELAAQSTANQKKLKAVINFWATNKLITTDDFNSIRERATEGLIVARGGKPVRKRTYALPDWFGDRSAPWHELPASYMLDSMIKHANRPIFTNSINVKRLDRKQPSERVRNLLEEYFENIDLKYVPTGDNPTGETKKYKLWLDPMGQLVKQNKDTGDTKTVCNGYGWSMKFCQDMQGDGVPSTISEARKLHEDTTQALEEDKRRAIEARSSPRRYDSRSPPPRRRYSNSSDDRYHSRSRSSSMSDDRPRSRGSDRDRYHDRRRRSPRDDDRDHHERQSRFDDRRDSDRVRQPPEAYNRNSPQRKPPTWNNGQSRQPEGNRNKLGGPGSNYNPNFVQGFPQGPQAPGFVPPPPPPVPGQFPGFPMQGFPPPPPPPPPSHFQAAGGHIPPPPPPPPPNFNGPYPGAPPNMGGFPNPPHNHNSNGPAYGNASGYGGQPQNNFRGGFGGGFQGRGGHRGGYQGSQQGRNGSRWS